MRFIQNKHVILKRVRNIVPYNRFNPNATIKPPSAFALVVVPALRYLCRKPKK